MTTVMPDTVETHGTSPQPLQIHIQRLQVKGSISLAVLVSKLTCTNV